MRQHMISLGAQLISQRACAGSPWTHRLHFFPRSGFGQTILPQLFPYMKEVVQTKGSKKDQDQKGTAAKHQIHSNPSRHQNLIRAAPLHPHTPSKPPCPHKVLLLSKYGS